MKSKTLRLLLISQSTILILFLFLTIGNEIFDIPHYIFNDTPTTFPQRIGEIILELSVFLIVMIIETVLFNKFYRRIRLLEGFLPICANCKKIKQHDQWKQIEEYISEHSLASFSHSLCPDCIKQLYPKIRKGKI